MRPLLWLPGTSNGSPERRDGPASGAAGDAANEQAAALDDSALASWYAYPPDTTAPIPWLRANFVSTLDGAVAGRDGRSGSINTGADRAVFALLRALCDVILVGAGTARVEGYAAARVGRRWWALRAVSRSGSASPRAPAPAMAVLSRSGALPARLLDRLDPADKAGSVVLVTCSAAPHSAVRAARRALGSEGVMVAGDDVVDIGRAVTELSARLGGRLLCEGGPGVLRQVVEAELLDELCLTTVPRLVGGGSGRLLSTGDLDLTLVPVALLEADGALLGRWVPAGRLSRLGGGLGLSRLSPLSRVSRLTPEGSPG